ncbi:uncharacterized protein si:ch211-102c2.4 [Polypterus senegalus]|uniref:uncharacterized protein si:ch211-102c2.4 n=1 Tax=Polypterus senegalus TaxID=55291 RepID=UPI0019629D02|nr:uncharacterized protein si:ch211-102c2.4 [Polypterus senegalus]
MAVLGVLLTVALPLGLHAIFPQVFECNYKEEHNSKVKVWCKQNANDNDCCDGYAVENISVAELNRGQWILHDQKDLKKFSVTVKTMATEDEGIYWCGVLENDQVIEKLSEFTISTKPPRNIWDILRWILMSIMLVVTFTVTIWTSRKNRVEEKTADLYEEFPLHAPKGGAASNVSQE